MTIMWELFAGYQSWFQFIKLARTTVICFFTTQQQHTMAWSHSSNCHSCFILQYQNSIKTKIKDFNSIWTRMLFNTWLKMWLKDLQSIILQFHIFHVTLRKSYGIYSLNIIHSLESCLIRRQLTIWYLLTVFTVLVTWSPGVVVSRDELKYDFSSIWPNRKKCSSQFQVKMVN